MSRRFLIPKDSFSSERFFPNFFFIVIGISVVVWSYSFAEDDNHDHHSTRNLMDISWNTAFFKKWKAANEISEK